MKNNKTAKIIIAVIVAAAVISVGFAVLRNQTAIDTSNTNIFSVKRMDLDESINLIGKGVSDNVSFVYSEIETPVEQVNVAVGDYVKVGDVICEFNVSELSKQRDEYVEKLAEYEKISKLKSSNYEQNLSYQKNVREKRMEYLNSMIAFVESEYDQTVQKENDYQNKYNSYSTEADNLKKEKERIDSESKELEEQLAVFQQSDTDNQNITAEIAEDIAADESTDTMGIGMQIPDQDEEMTQKMEHYESLKTESMKIGMLIEFVQTKKSYYDQMVNECKSSEITLQEQLKSLNNEYNQLKLQGSGTDLTSEEYELSTSGNDLKSMYQEQINTLNDKIDKAVVKSTVEGYITKIFVNSGDYVMGNPVCEIQDQSEMHFESYLSPSNFFKITTNNEILVSMVAGDDTEQIKGKILELSDYYDVENGGNKIVFTVDNIDEMTVYPGFEVSAKIIINQEKDTLVVPYDSIVEKDDKAYVYKYDPISSYSEEIEVQEGLKTSYYIAISSDEIAENDIVLTDMLG